MRSKVVHMGGSVAVLHFPRLSPLFLLGGGRGREIQLAPIPSDLETHHRYLKNILPVEHRERRKTQFGYDYPDSLSPPSDLITSDRVLIRTHSYLFVMSEPLGNPIRFSSLLQSSSGRGSPFKGISFFFGGSRTMVFTRLGLHLSGPPSAIGLGDLLIGRLFGFSGDKMRHT